MLCYKHYYSVWNRDLSIHWRLCITSDHWMSHVMRLKSVFVSTMFEMLLVPDIWLFYRCVSSPSCFMNISIRTVSCFYMFYIAVPCMYVLVLHLCIILPLVYVVVQGRLYSNVDFMIFGVATFLAGVVSLQLPETLNRPMVETAEEIDLAHGWTAQTHRSIIPPSPNDSIIIVSVSYYMLMVCYLLKASWCFYCRYHAYSVCMLWLYAVPECVTFLHVSLAYRWIR